MQTSTRNPVVTDARLKLGAVRLPALPEILLKLLALYRRDDASMAEFAQLIEADPAMATKVLVVANSAAYRVHGPVNDLQRCLNVLGTETVRTIVISQAIFQSMHSLPVLRRGDLGPFWRHSLLAANVARELARSQSGVQADEAYLAGLLHDVGRLGLLAAAPEFYAEGLSADDDARQCLAERRWLKVDHAEAGAWLIDQWRLSRALSDSVRYHHEPIPRLADADPLIRIVALAHLVACEAPDAKQVTEAGALCGLDLSQVSQIAAQASAKLNSTADQLGITIDRTGSPNRSSSAAEQLESEIETLMVATTLLSNLPLQPDETRQLRDLADAARMVFQFSEVLVMVPDGDDRLRCIGSDEPRADAAALRAFWLPCGKATRIGEALKSRQVLFIDRASDATDTLSVAEDQMLRLLSSEQLVFLPLRLGLKNAQPASGALICTGEAALIADLAAKRAFLQAFMARAEATRLRAEQQRDATERVRDRHAASQQAAARDLAHEINNPLTIVQNYLGVLDVKLGTSDALTADEQQDLSGDIAILQQEVTRVGRLVHALTTSAPMSTAGAVDVNRLIADVVRLFRTEAEACGIEISGHAHDVAHASEVERDLLEQVLINLVKNAVEAMSTPSAIAAARPDGARIVVANNGMINRDGLLWLEITVRDNGPGLPNDMLKRLFSSRPQEPELNRSEIGNPAPRGRGLAIVHRLVNTMGGAIHCRSSGAGTGFDILLPLRQTETSDAGSQLS